MTIEKASKFLKNNSKINTSIVKDGEEHIVSYHFEYKDNEYTDFVRVPKGELDKRTLNYLIDIFAYAKYNTIAYLRGK